MLQKDILGADGGACITMSMQAQCFRNSQRSHTNWLVLSIDLALLGITHNNYGDPIDTVWTPIASRTRLKCVHTSHLLP